MTRWHTIGWLVVTLAIITALIAPETEPGADLSRPLSTDREFAGTAALSQWLTSASIQVQSQRTRLHNPSTSLPTQSGHLLITHLPTTLFHEAEEIHAIAEWVTQGNTLLVVTGHLESSPWIYTGVDISRSLWRLTGLGLVPDKTEETAPRVNLVDSIDAALAVPGWLLLHGAKTTKQLTAPGEHPLTDSLGHLEVPWDRAHWLRYSPSTAAENASNTLTKPNSVYRNTLAWAADLAGCNASTTNNSSRKLAGQQGCIDIPTPTPDSWNILLTHRDSTQAALWSAPLGRGNLLVLLHPALLSNEGIHRFENRSFTMSLVDNYLGADGIVVIDDAHQGLNSIVQGSDMLSDSRFWSSIAFLLLFWIAYLLADSGHWARAVYRPKRKTIGQKDMIAGTANFLQQRLSAISAYDLAVNPLRTLLAKKWALSGTDVLADGLALESRRDPNTVSAIQDLLARISRGEKVDLVELHKHVNLLKNPSS